MIWREITSSWRQVQVIEDSSPRKRNYSKCIKENPGKINFGSSKHKLQVSKGSSYWESTVNCNCFQSRGGKGLAGIHIYYLFKLLYFFHTYCMFKCRIIKQWWKVCATLYTWCQILREQLVFSSESADVSWDEVPKLPYYSVSACY